jgi:hypothetical protein
MSAEIGKFNYTVANLNFSFPMSFIREKLSDKAFALLYEGGSYYYYEPEFESSITSREYRSEKLCDDGSYYIGQWEPGTEMR